MISFYYKLLRKDAVRNKTRVLRKNLKTSLKIKCYNKIIRINAHTTNVISNFKSVKDANVRVREKSIQIPCQLKIILLTGQSFLIVLVVINRIFYIKYINRHVLI